MGCRYAFTLVQMAFGVCLLLSTSNHANAFGSSSTGILIDANTHASLHNKINASARQLRPFQTRLYLHDAIFSDYSSAATALFNNMKTPASVLAAGMISIGFLAPIQVPPSIESDPKLLKRFEDLRRTYLTVTLISFCSELLAVMWATVAVNQLTERAIPPAANVWDLLRRDFDLPWAAVNSHFVVGLAGFMYMVGIRGYVMLQTAEASQLLVTAALSGVGSALCLMVSIVNRGIEAGGGDGAGYGRTVLDLFGHYVALLFQRATDVESFGPLELSAIGLEIVSIASAVYAIASSQLARILVENEQGVSQEIRTESDHSDVAFHRSERNSSSIVEHKRDVR